MLGSILSNLLLVLGMSFFAGGIVQKESNFRVTAAQTSASLMSLSCISKLPAFQIMELYHEDDVLPSLLLFQLL